MAPASTDTRSLQPILILDNSCPQGNPTPAISCLPTELLEAIFIQLSCEHFWYCTDQSPSPPAWIRICHVSSHWRTVALRCPFIWSYISNMSQRWSNIFLARSQQVSLKMYVNMGNSEHFALFQHYADRIEELRLYTRRWDMQIGRTFVMLNSTAPHLQTLEINMHPFPEESPRMVYDKDLSLWNSRGLAGLTTLSLQYVPDPLQQDIAGFQDMLGCMPDLVHLYLHDVLPIPWDFTPNEEPHPWYKVDLPRLSRLLIVSPLSTATAFFSGVNFPARTEVKLHCRPGYKGDGFSFEDYGRFCSVLAQHYGEDRVRSLPTIRSVGMELDPQRLALVFSTSVECDYLPDLYSITPIDWLPDILLEVTLVVPSSLDNSTLGSNICALMPTVDVHTLRVSEPPSCQAFWRKMWEYFPRSRCLKLNDGTILDGLATILPPHIADAGEPAEGQNRPILAPALEELKMNWMQLGEIGELEDSLDPSFRILDEELELIYATLSGREGSRGQLTMTECFAWNHCCTKYDMVGEWENGQFQVLSSRRYLPPDYDM